MSLFVCLYYTCTFKVAISHADSNSVAVQVIGYESSHHVYDSYYTERLCLKVCDRHWTLHTPVTAKLWMLLKSL